MYYIPTQTERGGDGRGLVACVCFGEGRVGARQRVKKRREISPKVYVTITFFYWYSRKCKQGCDSGFFSVWLLKSSWEKPLSIHPLSEKQRIATGGRKLFLWQAYKARFFSIFISPGNHLRPPCTMCTVSLIYPPPYFRVPTRWCWWSPRCTPTSRTGRGISSAGTTPRGGQFNWDKKTMTRGLEIGVLFSFPLKVCPEKALHSFSCFRTG